MVGIALENASQEMQKTGTKDDPKWEPKYSMSQLLDDKFRLPSPPTQKDRDKEALAGLRSMARTVSINPMINGGAK